MPRPLTLREVAVMPLSLTTVELKPELVETCIRYDVAPLDAFHESVGLVDTPVAPFAGVLKVGACGACSWARKCHTVDQLLVPAEFVAFTRQ